MQPLVGTLWRLDGRTKTTKAAYRSHTHTHLYVHAMPKPHCHGRNTPTHIPSTPRLSSLQNSNAGLEDVELL